MLKSNIDGLMYEYMYYMHLVGIKLQYMTCDTRGRSSVLPELIPVV